MKKYKYTVREIMIKTLNDILYPNYTGVNSRDYRIELDKALSMLQEKAPKNVRRVNKNKNLLQLQSESIKEFSQLEVEYWYERSRQPIVEPLCLDKDTEKVIKDFLSRWIKRAYESGKRGKIK